MSSQRKITFPSSLRGLVFVVDHVHCTTLPLHLPYPVVCFTCVCLCDCNHCGLFCFVFLTSAFSSFSLCVLPSPLFAMKDYAEEACTLTEAHFWCPIERRCLPSSTRCNYIQECLGGYDELACGKCLSVWIDILFARLVVCLG